MKWKKRAIAMLLTVSMLASASPFSTWAEENPQGEILSDAVSTDEPIVYTDEEFQYTELSDGTLSICGYIGENPEDESLLSVEVPESIDGKMVVQIGEKAFANNEAIETILLPENIAYIAEDAFADCGNLKGIAFCGEGMDVASSVMKDSEALEKIFVLAEGEFSAFLEQMKEALGEEAANKVEVLEYENLDELKNAYKEYADSLRKVPSDDTEEKEVPEEPAESEESVDTVSDPNEGEK